MRHDRTARGPPSLQNLGLALSGLGRLDEAAEAYQVAAAILDAAGDAPRAADTATRHAAVC